MKRLVIAISLIMMLLPAAAWSMGNLDFEGAFDANGVAEKWTAYDVATMSPETTIIHGGAKSQKITTGGEGGVWQDLDADVAGGTYTVSVWMKLESGQAWVGFDFGSGVAWADINGATTDWQKVSMSAPVGATKKVRLYLDGYQGVTYWDDASIVSAFTVPTSDIYTVWIETTHWQNGEWFQANAGNPIGHGQVLVDGDKTIIAQGQGGVMLYGDQQINGTAFVKSTPFWAYFFDPGAAGWPTTSNYSTKAGTLLNGRLYSQDMKMRILQSTLPTWEGPMTNNPGPWGAGDGPWHAGMETGRVESDCTGLVTDGTYLYGSDNPGAFAVGPAYVYKWAVNPSANGGNGALTEVWKVQIPTATWLISIGYYGGKLYAAEGFMGRNIYEIDCATGAYATILSGNNLIPEHCGTNAWYMGQIARCGNTLVLANWTGHLTQWQLIGGTWTLKSSDFGIRMAGYPDYLIGLSLKPGPDGNAKYAWLSGANLIYFVDLSPYSVKTDLGDANNWKNNYAAYVGDAVVTAVGADGFWVENKKRTMGAHVLWTGTMPQAEDVVSIKAKGGKSESGERILTASDVVVDTTYADMKPLFMTQKSLGPATGSAGLATDGMLVKVSGKVTGYDANYLKTIYIDDGSGVANDTPNADTATAVRGVKVIKGDGSDLYSIGFDFWGNPPAVATVIGILRLETLTDGTIVRRIEARSDADIKITLL